MLERTSGSSMGAVMGESPIYGIAVLFCFMAELGDADKREEGDGLKQDKEEAVGWKPQKCRCTSTLYQAEEADKQDGLRPC